MKPGFSLMLSGLLVTACSLPNIQLPEVQLPNIPGLPSARRPPAPPPCPDVQLLEDTEQVVKYLQGPGRDLTDVILVATIADFQGTCETDFLRDGSGQVSIDLSVVFRADKGPANNDNRGEFAYFIAIADSADRILAKEIFPISVAFPVGQRLTFAEDSIYQEIELFPGDLGSDFAVFVGMQLTPEELRRNRE
jgi:hypothetical protein